MGFGDFLKEVGKATVEGVKAFGEKNLEYEAKWEEKFSRMSDESLKSEARKIRDGHGSYGTAQETAVRTAVLSRILKERNIIK